MKFIARLLLQYRQCWVLLIRIRNFVVHDDRLEHREKSNRFIYLTAIRLDYTNSIQFNQF